MSERTVIPSPDTLIAHAGFIRAVARKLLLDDHEVDDVVQQTLLAALEKPPQRPGPLKPWLATVARNLARMRRRTEGRIDRREQAAARPESTPATGEIAERLEMQRKLVEVVTALDEPYRDVVVLRFFDELPPREVAARLGIPVETVRTRTRRALEQLRGQLDRKTEGGRKAWQLALLPLALPPARAQAAMATATVGILGAIGVKSIASIAAVLLAAVFFLWHEASGDSESGVPRVTETKRSDGGAATNALTAGESSGLEAADGGGARGTNPPADFVYRAVVVDEEGEPVRGAKVSASERGVFVTDANGTIAVDGHAGQHYLGVVVKKDGYVPLTAAIDPWTEAPERFVLRRGRALRVRLLSPRGAPVVGARCNVELKEVIDDTPNRSVFGWQDEREVPSDADGIVDLGQVPSSELKLAVDHTDFAWFTGEWTAEEVAAGEIEIRLSVGATVRGIVTGPDGQPVVGATVVSRVKKTTTGTDGRYELAHVVTDGVEIVASHPLYGPAGFGAVLGWNSDIPVRVADGEAVDGIDIVLGPATRVRGRLVDHKGDPVAGLTINAYVMGGTGRTNAARSDEQGRFEAGPYKLKSEQATWHIFYTKNTSHSVPDGLKWTLRRGETTDVGDITVQTRPIVRGRVVDASGNPVAPRARATVETGGTLNWVNPDGTYEVQFEPGTRRIFATAKGEGDIELRSEQQIVELRENQTIELELRVRATVEVTGSIVDSRGTPQMYAGVVLIPADAPIPWNRGTMQQTGTDREGNFKIYVAKPGEYIAGIPQPGTDKEGRFRPDVPTRAITVEKQPIEGLRFEIPAKKQEGVRVFGRVVSAETGKPVKNFALRLIKYKFFMPDHTFYFGIADQDGRFEQWAELPGTYAAKIEQDGYSAQMTKTFSVKDKGEVDLGTIKLSPALKVTGLVRDSNGTPVPYAQIHLLGGLGELGGQTFSGADGRFVIDNADAGVFNVFAVSPRHPVAILKGVTVGQGEESEITIEVPDTSPMTIRVKDENGRPVEGATLVWTFPEVAPFTSEEFGGYEPPSFGDNKSDADGVISKPFTPSAPITARIVAKGFATDLRVIQTEKGKPIEIEVVLKRK